jgi:hypothetical protein
MRTRAPYDVAILGGRLPGSPKTIHRYRPSSYLGGTGMQEGGMPAGAGAQR